MTRRRPHIPKMQSLVIVTCALQNFIPSSEPKCEFRTSLKGVPNLRYEAETNGINWSVDIYMGHFYRAHVGGKTGVIHNSIQSLLGYLSHALGVIQQAQ